MASEKITQRSDLPDLRRRNFVKALGAGVAVAAIPAVPKSARAQQPTAIAQRIPLDLKTPLGMACDAHGGFIVAESGRYRIVRIDEKGREFSTFGGPGSAQGKFNWPTALRRDNHERLWVVDSNNGRVVVHDADGKFLGQYGRLGGTPGTFFTPGGLCVTNGLLYVANTRGHNVQVFDIDTAEVMAVFGILGDDPNPTGPTGYEYGLRLPTSVALVSDGLLILDSKHGRVIELDGEGMARRAYGGLGSGPGQLNLPQDMLADDSGRVIVADTGNRRLSLFENGQPLDAPDLDVGAPVALDRTADGRIAVLDGDAPAVVLVEGLL